MERSAEEKYLDVVVGRLDEVLRELGEHFDCIQILGTYMDEVGNTCRVTRGVGNWYARQGVAREFLEMDAAATTAFELSKVIGRVVPSDDSEDWKG